MLTVLVGIIPVFLLGWYSYYHTSTSVSRQLEEGNARVVKQSQLRVEQTLKMIDYSTSQLLNLPIITKSMSKDLAPADFELINELYNNLYFLQSYELGIRDVYLLSVEKDWLLSNTGLNMYSDTKLKDTIQSFKTMDKGSIWISSSSNKMQEVTKELKGLQHSVINIKKWPINSMNPRGMISTVLSAQQLNYLIDAETTLGKMYILDEEDRVIAHSDETQLGVYYGSHEYVKKMHDNIENNGVLYEAVEGEKVTLSYIKSAYNQWIYVFVVPTEAATKQAVQIGWTTILVSIAVLIATVVVAVIGSNRVYNPVRLVYRSVLDDKNTHHQNDEFTVITNSIQNMRIDHSKLKVELEGQHKQVVELLVRKLLLGEANPQLTMDRLQYYGYGYAHQWEHMRILQIQLDSLNKNRYAEKDRDLLLFAISNIASEIMLSEKRLPPIVMKDAIVIIVGTASQSEDAFKSMIFDMATEVQEAVEQYLQLPCSIGMSRSFNQWLDTNRSYVESGNALKYRTRLGEKAVLFIEDVQPEAGKEIIYPRQHAEELTQSIKSLDEERANQTLSAMMKELSLQEYSHNDYQLALVRLLMELISLLQDTGISYHVLKSSKQSLFEDLMNLHSSKEIELWFKQKIVVPTIQLLELQRQGQFSSISSEVKKLIEEAFDTDLTLEKLSNRLNYHPQYISRVFRQETGITFADYLSQYRLKVAKKWLKGTDLTVTEIAERLKYNNPANFIRYFRKMEGITPGQYREQGVPQQEDF